MKRFLLVILFFSAAIAYYYIGVFLGDLAHIGGYDGFAPQWLYQKFQYGDYPLCLYKAVELSALSCLVMGPLGVLASALFGLYQLVSGVRALLRTK